MKIQVFICWRYSAQPFFAYLYSYLHDTDLDLKYEDLTINLLVATQQGHVGSQTWLEQIHQFSAGGDI